MCYHVYVIMHVKDPWLSFVRVGYHVPLASFCLSLYSLHVLNRDVNMIQINKTDTETCLICISEKFEILYMILLSSKRSLEHDLCSTYTTNLDSVDNLHLAKVTRTNVGRKTELGSIKNNIVATVM